MNNRFPLVLDTSNNTNRIKEIPVNDNLFLRNNNIIDVRDIRAVGTIDARDFTINGFSIVPESLALLTQGIADNPGKYVKVNNQGTGFEFTDQIGGALSEFENDLGFVTVNEVEDLVSTSIQDIDFERITFVNSGRSLVVSPETLTQNRTLVLPDGNGTIATREWVGVLTGASEKSYNSVFKCNATVLSANLTNGRVSTLEQIEFINNFRTGDYVRVYGANELDGLTITSNAGINFSLSKNGFENIPAGDGISVEYRIAKFNIENGNISPATNSQSIIVNSLVPFDENNNVRLFNISGISNTEGALIYRRFAGQGWELFAILGPGSYSGGTYIDYGTSDNNTWSGLDPDKNIYTQDQLIHFPLTPPTTRKYGWSTARITAIDFDNNTITLDRALLADVGTVNISSDDTIYLQDLIQDQVDSGKTSLKLADVSYVVSKISLPNNFILHGVSGRTVIHKMPWSVVASDTTSTTVIQSVNRIEPTNIGLADLSIDGNLTNQFLVRDSVDDSLNYAINFGTQGLNIKINNVDLYSVIGGGLYATSTSNLTITRSKFRNGTISDRFEYSPAIVYETTNAIISENIFENFTSAVDVSVSRESVVANNIIKNVGTGLLVYASRNLISSPNVLMGPANELLPSPDILNSVYDSVNIILEPGLQFTSDKYRYQENGENFNLIANSNNKIIYELWKLEKTEEGFEQLYEKITDVIIVNVPAGNNPAQGEFQFRIPKVEVDKVLTDYNFTTLKIGKPTHVGLVYRTLLEENVSAATIDTNSPGIVGTGGLNNYPTDTYTVSVTNANYLSIDAEVRLVEHLGFATNPNVPVGKVYALDINPDNTGFVTIQFAGSTITPGIGGTINIINQFVMAKGRVL